MLRAGSSVRMSPGAAAEVVVEAGVRPTMLCLSSRLLILSRILVPLRYVRGTKIRLSINNLLDKHNIVGLTPASTTTSAAAPGDILTLLPARSIGLTVTFGYAPGQ